MMGMIVFNHSNECSEELILLIGAIKFLMQNLY
jgi:hypothetical protein